MAQSVKRLVEIALRADTGEAEGSVDGLVKKFTGLSTQQLAIAAAAAGMGTALVKAFARATEAAVVFEKSMAEVRTLTNASAGETRALSDEIQALSVEFGQLDSDMAQASYNVVSAGFGEMAEQTELLAVAAKAAIAGVSDVNTAAKVITQTLNAYKLSFSDAAHVSDVLFSTVKGGVTTFEELARNLGKVTATAATAGISFEEVAAALAVMTKNGISTEEATTALNSLIVALGASSGESKEKLEALGISLDGGLAPALAAVDAAGGDSLEILRELIPNIRALKAAASAGADGAKELSEQLKKINESAGDTNTAFKIMSETVAAKTAEMDAAAQRARVSWGEMGLAFKELGVEQMRDFYNGMEMVGRVLSDADRAARGVKNSLEKLDEAMTPERIQAMTTMAMLGEEYAIPKEGEDYEYKGKGQDNDAIRKKTEELRKKNQEWRDLLASIAEVEQRLAFAREALLDQSTKDKSLAYFDAGQAFTDGITVSDIQASLDMAASVPLPRPDEAYDYSGITDETLKAWQDWQEAVEDMNTSIVDMGAGFAQVGAQGVSTFLGLRDGAFRMGDALKNVVATAIEQVITKLLIVKAINPFMGFLGLKEGGTVPGMAPGGKVMRAAAGMIVPNIAQAGMDSVPIMAMPGEGVIKRDIMQSLETFLNSHAAMATVTPGAMGGETGGAVTIQYNIARPVSYRDHLDLGRNAVRAQREASRRVL
jgi:TP901 family phage tail tape measure protein